MDLKANTAVDVLIGPFVDDSDGNTTEEALTLSQADILLSKNGQALAQKNDATAAAHDDLGYYNCELDATDTNTEGNLVLVVHESGALPVRHEFNVLAEAAWDSLYAAKDTGYMDVNVKAVSEDTTAADNAEAFFDGTGYAGTNNVIPTVTTLTGHTAQTGDSFARLGAPAGASVSADIATVDGNVDSVLTDTGTTLDGKLDTIDGIVDAILVDTGTTLPATLTTIEGKIDTVDGNVDSVLTDTGTTLDGKIDTIDGIVDAILVDTGTTLPATLTTMEGKIDTVDTVADGIQTDLDNATDGLGALKALIDALNDLDAAAINAEVLDVLNTDTFAEPGDEAPTATTTLADKIGYLYKFMRNKVETTSTRIHVYDDAGTNKDQSSTISDDGSTFTRGEFGAGDA